MDLIWHIDSAQFEFNTPDDYEVWKESKKVFFEFSPAEADDFGEDLFIDPENQGTHFEITEDNGNLKIDLGEKGPIITAWVQVSAKVNDEFDEDHLLEWAAEFGGWASSTIDLGEFEASITEDDGGDWRLGESN